MKSKWEEFSVALAGSGELKALIDIAGGIAKAFTGMTNTFGTAAIALTPLIAMMSKTSNFGKVLNMPSYWETGRMRVA